MCLKTLDNKYLKTITVVAKLDIYLQINQFKVEKKILSTYKFCIIYRKEKEYKLQSKLYIPNHRHYHSRERLLNRVAILYPNVAKISKIGS